VNIYDIYRHCYYPEDGLLTGTTTINGVEKIYKRGMTAQEYTPWLFKHHNARGLKVDVPCVYATGPSDYFNRQDVRMALHIETEQVWELCTDRIDYERGDIASQWVYPLLKDAGIRIIHYSGNTDGAVPTEGTRSWIHAMGWTVKSAYQPYFIKNNQIGGFVEERDGIIMATI
jgi:hypothetical protein